MELLLNFLSSPIGSPFYTEYIEKYNNAKKWYNDHFNCECTDRNILSFIINNIENSLTIEDIIEVFCFVNCICEIDYPDNHICDIKRKCLYKRGGIFSCTELPLIYEYYLLYKEVPSNEDMLEIQQRLYEFDRNPEEFHQKDKILVPTLNLDKLSPIVKDSPVDENCSLCQSTIHTKPFYKIPPCNHLFHANSEDCLGDSSIINWLSNHKQCPNCKTIVEIPYETVE